MKSLTVVLAAIGLLAQVSAALADPMLIRPRSLGLRADAPTEHQDRWSLSLQATSWDVPDNTNAGFRVEVETEVRPVAVLEYRPNDRIAVGGWYNPIKWKGTAVNLATGAAAPAFTETGALFEVYGTYSLPGDYAVQLAYQRLQGSMTIPGDPREYPDELHWLGIWGMKSFDLSDGSGDGLGALASVGLSAPLNVYTADKSQAATMLHGMVGLSYAVAPWLSLDASAWLLNVTGKTSRTRFNGGVSGRF
jgi:hypothetical protein